MSTFRKLDLNGTEWEYQIGKSHVVIKTPTKTKKHIVDFSSLLNKEWSVIERGQQKGTADGMVKPSDVKGYIEKYKKELVALG